MHRTKIWKKAIFRKMYDSLFSLDLKVLENKVPLSESLLNWVGLVTTKIFDIVSIINQIFFDTK